MQTTNHRAPRLLMLCLFAVPGVAMAGPQPPPAKAQAAPTKEASPPVEEPPAPAVKPKAPAVEPMAPAAGKSKDSYGTPRVTGKPKVMPARVCALYELGAVAAAKADVGLDATCKCAATKDACQRNWRGAQKRWHDCTCDKPPRCDVDICSRVQAVAVGKALMACKKPSCSCHRLEKRVCGDQPAATKGKGGAEGSGPAKKGKTGPPAAYVYRCDCP